MKKILAEITVIFAVALYLFTLNKGSIPGEGKTILLAPVLSPSKAQNIRKAPSVSKTLFIPYWTLGKTKINSSDYNTLVYFGITADKKGIDHTDTGFQQIGNFMNQSESWKKRILGIRMINANINDQVLTDSILQEKIISDSIDAVKAKGFNGVCLDFEQSALGFNSVVQSITNFEEKFAESVKSKHLLFFTTLYGDTFARLRPFNVSKIASSADGVMIMAYDFHKANGDPGPNFPLQAADEYNMEIMTDDFLKDIAPQKITIIFGMYGYDWTVDEKGRTIGQAEALSFNQIKQKFLDNCPLSHCKIIRDKLSTETEITYTDKANHAHMVWFEDSQSTEKKTAYLQSRGISSVGYWAYSYF